MNVKDVNMGMRKKRQIFNLIYLQTHTKTLVHLIGVAPELFVHYKTIQNVSLHLDPLYYKLHIEK